MENIGNILNNNNNSKSTSQTIFNPEDKIFLPSMNNPICRKNKLSFESKGNMKKESIKRLKINSQNVKSEYNNRMNTSNSILLNSNTNSRYESNSSKDINSNLFSLNCSFESTENFDGSKKVKCKDAHFLNNLNKTKENIRDKNTQNLFKKNNITGAATHNSKKRQNQENEKIKKKFTQKVAQKSNKDTHILAQHIQNNQRVKYDADLKKNYIKEFLFSGLLKLEIDVLQQKVNDQMLILKETTQEVTETKAECASEIEFKTEIRDKYKQETIILEEDLRKLDIEYAILNEKEIETSEKIKELQYQHNISKEMEMKIDFDIHIVSDCYHNQEQETFSQLKKLKKQELYMQQNFMELYEIQKNMAVLKPYFKKNIIVRGVNKNNFEIGKTSKFIKINENEFKLNLIVPQLISKEEENCNNIKNSKINCVDKNVYYENYTVFYDEIFSLYNDNLYIIDDILEKNNQDALLNRDITNILNAYFNKYNSYIDKEKKDFFCLYLSDPIKYNNKNLKDVSLNKNFFICLEKHIKHSLSTCNCEISYYLITDSEFVSIATNIKLDMKDSKRFDFTDILKYESGKVNSNLENNEELKHFSSNKEEAKNYLINNYEIEFQTFNSNNYTISENLYRHLQKITKDIYGIYIKISGLKNNTEFKFLYFDINQALIYNDIIKKISDISNKQTNTKSKINKKADQINEEKKISYMISEKIGLNNIKYSSCFMDLIYDININQEEVENILIKENKEYEDLGLRETKNYTNVNSTNEIVIEKNSFPKKNSITRSNSFNKGTNNNIKSPIGIKNDNSIIKDTNVFDKEESNNKKKIRISPLNRKNSNTNSNNNSYNKLTSNYNKIITETNKILNKNNSQLIHQNSDLNNIKAFDKDYLKVLNEEGFLKLNSEKYNYNDKMDIEILNIKEQFTGEKEEKNYLLKNVDSFGKSKNSNEFLNKSEDQLQNLNFNKILFNFNWRNFNEIFKYFKEK